MIIFIKGVIEISSETATATYPATRTSIHNLIQHVQLRRSHRFEVSQGESEILIHLRPCKLLFNFSLEFNEFQFNPFINVPGTTHNRPTGIGYIITVCCSPLYRLRYLLIKTCIDLVSTRP